MRWGGDGGRLNQRRSREKAKGRTHQRDPEKVDFVAFGKQSEETWNGGRRTERQLQSFFLV